MANDNYSNSRVLFLALAVVALGVYFCPTSVKALTLTPTRFEIPGNPGDVLSEEMTLINDQNDTETFYPTYSNFEAQGESGTPTFVVPKDDLGTWMTTADSVTLSPGQQKVIPFQITIPKDAEPGGHFAVIFWGTTPPGNNKTVSIGAKTGILVLLSVNGDVKQDAGLLSFNTKGNQFWFSTLPITFEYRFNNAGGDRIKPLGRIALLDTLFIPTQKLDANPTQGNILPASIRRFDVDWIKYERPVDYVAPTGFFSKFWSDVTYQWKNFAVGLYSAHLNLAYGNGPLLVNKTIYFFVFPWQLILVMLVILIIVFWGGRRTIRRYNRYIIERAGAGMQR